MADDKLKHRQATEQDIDKFIQKNSDLMDSLSGGTRPPTPADVARDAWDIWSAEKYIANAPNEVVAEIITARVAAAIQQAVDCAVEDIASFVENEQQAHRQDDHVVVSETHVKIAAAIRARGAKKEDERNVSESSVKS